MLETDIASVMLLDVHAHQLVTTAAKGLEEELRIGFRLSVGRGFAGQVAQQGTPLIIEDVRPEDVASDVLRQRGVRSLLGVPMQPGGDLVGVLVVGSLAARSFADDDVKLLQLVADRASMASQVRLNRQDRLAALALQRSLLPTRLPAVPGLELAARYVPGHDTGVGGDWYDVFVLPTGWLGIVVGDVSGHGLAAAVVMGRLRSALRAYALECEDPADALMRLDRKIHHFEAGSLATALYAMVAPDLEHGSSSRWPDTLRRPWFAPVSRPTCCGCPSTCRWGPGATRTGATRPSTCRPARCSPATPTASSNGAASPSTPGSSGSGPRCGPTTPSRSARR